MSRNDKIEEILAAWYRLKTAEDKHKAAALASLNRVLDDARTGTNASRTEVMEALRRRLDDYCRQKTREENKFRRR